METTYGGKGKQAEDGEAEVSYLCARCGCGKDMGFVGEFVGFTPLSVVLQLRQPYPPCTWRVQNNLKEKNAAEKRLS